MAHIRIGYGYDTHALAEGRPLWLGGVRIEHTHGLTGHSDADVLIHAICDALLGAAALGDIGQLFPDTDPQWKDAGSAVFLEGAGNQLREAGYLIGNIDATVLAEAPKLAPHVPAMRERLAELLDLNTNQVSVKATRGEGMGPVGRAEAIAAQAVALVERQFVPPLMEERGPQTSGR
mgnify:CR=1 FL=1